MTIQTIVGLPDNLVLYQDTIHKLLIILLILAEDINNATKDEILRRIADKLQQFSDEDVRGPLSIKLQLLKAQPNKAKKDTLILLYNEIVEELEDLQAMQEACIPQDEGENDNK